MVVFKNRSELLQYIFKSWGQSNTIITPNSSSLIFCWFTMSKLCIPLRQEVNVSQGDRLALCIPFAIIKKIHCNPGHDNKTNTWLQATDNLKFQANSCLLPTNKGFLNPIQYDRHYTNDRLWMILQQVINSTVWCYFRKVLREQTETSWDLMKNKPLPTPKNRGGTCLRHHSMSRYKDSLSCSLQPGPTPLCSGAEICCS